MTEEIKNLIKAVEYFLEHNKRHSSLCGIYRFSDSEPKCTCGRNMLEEAYKNAKKVNKKE